MQDDNSMTIFFICSLVYKIKFIFLLWKYTQRRNRDTQNTIKTITKQTINILNNHFLITNINQNQMESNLKISTELVKVSCYTKSNALGLSKCFKAYREDDNCNYIMDVSFPGNEVCMVIYNTDINTTFTLCSFMGRDIQYIINYGNSSEVCFDHYEDLKNHFSITI